MRALLTALFLISAPAGAECVGQNLVDTMPTADRARIEVAANAVPYAKGNFWNATKGDATMTLIGTYHLDDPRHEQTMATIGPMIDAASTVLVEGGPDEQAAMLDRMGRDPSVLVLQDDTLLQHMPPEDWALLSAAMLKRGIPPFMAAKFQPWYLALMLGIPPCKMDEMAAPHGLDARVIERAAAADVPLRALEPYDTLFTLFDQVPFSDQIDMIVGTLALEDRVDDFAITLADSYFRGETWMIWELMRFEALKLPGYTPERIETEYALMEEVLMSARNRNWIPVLENASTKGPVFAAFGALHLPGQDGVLALLDRAGWVLEPLPLNP